MNIRVSAIAVILSLTAFSPAQALSCLNPSIMTLTEHSKSQEDMVIVYGQLGADAVFTGVEMRPGAPDLAVSFTVPEIQTRPHMGWIAGPAAPIRGPVSPMPLDTPFVGPVFGASLDSRAFSLGVCSPDYITNPAPDLIAKIRACLDDGQCADG